MARATEGLRNAGQDCFAWGKSAVPATFMRAAAMAGFDQMNEQELIRELQRLVNECHRLDQEISHAI